MVGRNILHKRKVNAKRRAGICPLEKGGGRNTAEDEIVLLCDVSSFPGEHHGFIAMSSLGSY